MCSHKSRARSKSQNDCLGKWNSSSSGFPCEVMRSEAGQDRWNNIIRSLREEERGHIIRLNTAKWKCMGGKMLTPLSLSVIQFPAPTLCRWYSCRAVRLRPTNFNVHCLRCPIYHPHGGDRRRESKAGKTLVAEEAGEGGEGRGQYWNLRSEKTIVVSTVVRLIYLFRSTSSRYNKYTHTHTQKYARGGTHRP